MLLRKYFHWNISFCDPQIEGLPRSVISIEFPLLCNSLFSKNKKTQFCLLGLNQNRPICKKSTTLKNRSFCVLRHNSHSPKILENAIIIDMSHYSNWKFWTTPGLCLSIKISVETLTLTAEKLDLKTIDIIPCNKNLIVQIFQKVVTKTDSSR